MNSLEEIIFIITPCYELEDDRLEPHLGSLYMATFLNQHGYKASITDLSSVLESNWDKKIPSAQVYCFPIYSVTYHRTLRLKELIKEKYPNSITIAGGPHATALPRESSEQFDIVVTGEGEQAVLEVITALKFKRLANFPKIVKGIPIQNLDALPFPDYKLVDLSSYHRIVNGSPSISLISSRGCDHKCAFCNSIVFGHNHVRMRSPENVAEEIGQLKDTYGISHFRFNDDLFTTSIERIRRFTELFSPLNINYRCFARLDNCSQEMTDLLFKGGCRHIALGVESCSQKMLDAMRKKQTVDDIRQGITNAKASGLMVRIYLIVGFPGETWETVQETSRILEKCPFDEFVVYPFIPYPGTPIWFHPANWGITHIERDYSRYVQIGRGRNTVYSIRTSTFNEHDVQEWRDYMIKKLSQQAKWAGESACFK